MENLNDLIWTDEEDSGNNNIQPQQHDPMKYTCNIMIESCGAGSFAGCIRERVNGMGQYCS